MLNKMPRRYLPNPEKGRSRGGEYPKAYFQRSHKEKLVGKQRCNGEYAILSLLQLRLQAHCKEYPKQ
jgi:hypothetical protein